MTKDKLIKLRDVQKEADSLAAELKAKRDAFAKSIEADTVRKTELDKQVSALKAELSTEALNDFNADPEKKKTRYCGIKIKESTGLEYDETTALNWAKEKDMFLSLDKKAFEKAAPGMQLDFVKTIAVKKVTFPTAGVVVED